MLEAATLPIRGQEEKSAFGAHRSRMRRSSSLAGAISHARRLVSSNPEASESQASTHMYNCRRARFGSVWGSCVGHPPASSSGHFALASRWSLLTTSPRQPSNRPQPRPSSRLTDNHRRNRSVQDIGQGYGLHSRNTTIGHISAASQSSGSTRESARRARTENTYYW